mmetsp:Transcript_34675/g.6246  ORF Transcript_34675/g.6246 Transcript_34675/m.6246 type:complete len:103 (-) Transcript_34675:262-570(-)
MPEPAYDCVRTAKQALIQKGYSTIDIALDLSDVGCNIMSLTSVYNKDLQKYMQNETLIDPGHNLDIFESLPNFVKKLVSRIIKIFGYNIESKYLSNYGDCNL